MPRPREFLILLNLFKPPISLMSAGAALLGHAAVTGRMTDGWPLLALSVLFLSAGAAALNNYQDRHIDRLMPRTRGRAIAANQVRPLAALTTAIVLIALGLGGLLIESKSARALGSGIVAVFLYNGVYSPLKKKSWLAFLPGILSGMMPPLIGWLAAGGRMDSPALWCIMLFFGIWQVPHTWLHLLLFHRDYQGARLPTMLDIISAAQLKRLIFIWLLGYSVMSLCIGGLVQHRISHIALTGNALAMAVISLRGCIFSGKDRSCAGLFHWLSISAACVILITLAAVIFH